MNYKVAASIYHKPWLIEREAAISYLELLEQIKAGKAIFEREPSNQLMAFAATSSVVVAPTDTWAAEEHQGYEGKSIAILPVIGPLMKADYCGSFGTASLRNELAKINATESVHTIVFLFDSPGGSVDGNEAFAAAIKNSPKDTVGIIDGVCGSASYWLASCCQRLVATSKTDIIGSIGTMFTVIDRSAYMEEMGIVVREYFADASADKNLMFIEAQKGINKGRLLIEQLLNPMNDVFVAAVKANRGKKLNEEETLSGKIFLADKAQEYGLIDAVEPFETTINNLLQREKNPSITMSTSKWTKFFAAIGLASLSADKSELKDEHIDKVEASLAELETAKAELATSQARVTELETAATASQQKITGLEAQVTALTTERDSLKAEVEKLGRLDAGRMTTTTSEGDTFTDEKVDPSAMDFQQQLLAKV